MKSVQEFGGMPNNATGNKKILVNHQKPIHSFVT